MAADKSIPVSTRRVQECLASAKKWEAALGDVAKDAQASSTAWAWIGVISGSLVTLGIWPTIAASTAWPALAAVSFVAFVSALASGLPKVRGYDNTAKEAASLQSAYGHVIGELTDVSEATKDKAHSSQLQAAARKAVDEFESLKKGKDALHLSGKSSQRKAELDYRE